MKVWIVTEFRRRWIKTTAAGWQQYSKSCESCCNDHLENSDGVEKVNRMSYSARLKNIETINAFFEQQRVVTYCTHTTALKLVWPWCKRKGGTVEKNIDYSFLQKINFHIQIYSMWNTVFFFTETFLFDMSLYFLCNVIGNWVTHLVGIYPCIFHYSVLSNIYGYLMILPSHLVR